ncbi:hypothetical protein SSYM_2617 [Serratia symbiotica str. Tucson]|uniref:Uncharacterized protein n=1 Tax=Serratia symbiotica str. Tucson TaxID=914128 RepID=E9CPW5_9GAMM|nr:hypothetical protein SSYM_2617 [Serratia symbiotica str. Tucson]
MGQEALFTGTFNPPSLFILLIPVTIGITRHPVFITAKAFVTFFHPLLGCVVMLGTEWLPVLFIPETFLCCLNFFCCLSKVKTVRYNVVNDGSRIN